MPSASTTSGTSLAKTAASTSRPASSVPMPGPTAHACVRPAASTVAEVITSVQRARTPGVAEPAKRTMPLVASTAAPVARTAAPG
jgi:hypothetical protein